PISARARERPRREAQTVRSPGGTPWLRGARPAAPGRQTLPHHRARWGPPPPAPAVHGRPGSSGQDGPLPPDGLGTPPRPRAAPSGPPPPDAAPGAPRRPRRGSLPTRSGRSAAPRISPSLAEPQRYRPRPAPVPPRVDHRAAPHPPAGPPAQPAGLRR